MIVNVILLLVANTFVPFFPFQPLVLLPTPYLLFQMREPSVYENMNLTRLYNQTDLKKSFRQSLKTHHPDHGGKREIFQQIQGLKKIMQQKVNYHDLYNVTDMDLSSNSNLKLSNVVEIKEITFYLELGIFYFIAILYILAFTIEEQVRSSRKYLLLLAFSFLGYEYFINDNPQTVTFIDHINDKIPLFEQKLLLKRTFILILSILRAHFLKKKTIIKELNQSLEKSHTTSEYKDILIRLLQQYNLKVIEKEKTDKSLWSKAKNFISKGFSFFFMGLVIYNLVIKT